MPTSVSLWASKSNVPAARPQMKDLNREVQVFFCYRRTAVCGGRTRFGGCREGRICSGGDCRGCRAAPPEGRFSRRSRARGRCFGWGRRNSQDLLRSERELLPGMPVTLRGGLGMPTASGGKRKAVAAGGVGPAVGASGEGGPSGFRMDQRMPRCQRTRRRKRRSPSGRASQQRESRCQRFPSQERVRPEGRMTCTTRPAMSAREHSSRRR